MIDVARTASLIRRRMLAVQDWAVPGKCRCGPDDGRMIGTKIQMFLESLTSINSVCANRSAIVNKFDTSHTQSSSSSRMTEPPGQPASRDGADSAGIRQAAAFAMKASKLKHSCLYKENLPILKYSAYGHS